MSESKVFMFPETGTGSNGLMSVLAPLLQQRGLDPNLLLMSRNNCGFGEGGWFMWVIFLFFLMGWGGNGWGNFGNRGNLAGDAYLGNLINNDTGRELLMSAIQGGKLYDAVYVANWCKSYLYGSSISDEKHFILFIKDILDKQGHLLFNRWYADMAKQGIPIEWSDMI